MRTLRTRKGLEVNTQLSDEQAADIVTAVKPSPFGIDLASKQRRGFKLSEDQLAWLHKMALDATGRGHFNQRSTGVVARGRQAEQVHSFAAGKAVLQPTRAVPGEGTRGAVDPTPREDRAGQRAPHEPPKRAWDRG